MFVLLSLWKIVLSADTFLGKLHLPTWVLPFIYRCSICNHQALMSYRVVDETIRLSSISILINKFLLKENAYCFLDFYKPFLAYLISGGDAFVLHTSFLPEL